MSLAPTEGTSPVRRIVRIQLLTWTVCLCVLVVDDLVDFSSRGLEVDWDVAEVLALAVAGIISTRHVRQLAGRIRTLEGILRVCMYCKSVHEKDRWVPVDQYIAGNTAADISHGLCPSCLEKKFPETGSNEGRGAP